MTLKRISSTDEELSVGFSVTGTEEKTITLAPGRYELDDQLIRHEGVKIPAEVRCEDVPSGTLGLGEKEECFTIPETVFDIYPAGGVNFDTNDTYWELKPNNLYKGNKINFIALEVALPDVPEGLRKIEDIGQMGAVPELSKEHKKALSPRTE